MATLQHQLQPHFGLAAQSFDADPKGAPVRTYRLAQGIVSVKDRPKAERKNGSIPEAHAHHPGVLQYCFFIHFVACAVIFADYNGEFSAGIAQDGGSAYTLDAFQQEGTPGTGTIGECLMFGQAVCVPRHIDLSEFFGQRRAAVSFLFAKVGSDFVNLEERAVKARTDVNRYVTSKLILLPSLVDLQQLRGIDSF